MPKRTGRMQECANTRTNVSTVNEHGIDQDPDICARETQ